MTRRQKRPISRHRQRGVALLMVMLILAMMVAVSAVMSERLFSQFRRAQFQMSYQQAYWYAISVESLAKAVIEKSAKKDSDSTTNTSQPWATGIQNYQLDQGSVSGMLTDKQACFNLNSLSSDSATTRTYLVNVLQYLMEAVGTKKYNAEVAADSVREFIDSNNAVDTSYGVEDSYYENLSPPYLPPNAKIADASEIRGVQQVSASMMKKLSPMLCALPTSEWSLNINTITTQQADLLVALFYPYISKKAAETLIASRPASGWDSVATFLTASAFAKVDSTALSKAKTYLNVMSNYFELDAEVTVNDTKLRIRSLFDSEDREHVVVVRRRFGGVDERISDHSAKQPDED